MRALAIALLLAGCAKPQSATAITLGGPLATPPPAPIVDRTSERITTARDDIQSERYDAATKTLLSIVCAERVAQTEPELARCTPPPGIDATDAWGLIGSLAASGNFAFGTSQWTDAQRVVAKWSNDKPREQANLAIAELAYARAAAASHGAGSMLLQLAIVQERRHACGRALPNLVRVIESGSKHVHDDAQTRIIECIVDEDWDGDGTKDDVRGFARPEVRAALAPQKPWVSDVYVHALESFFDDGDCEDFRPGYAELVQRFPTHPHLGRLAQIAQGCP